MLKRFKAIRAIVVWSVKLNFDFIELLNLTKKAHAANV